MSDDPNDLLFEWDPEKARKNVEKHGVTFEEAATVFFDDLAKIDDDPDHSIGERCELIYGCSVDGRWLLVVFTERRDVIRIIHARLATKSERRKYEEDVL